MTMYQIVEDLGQNKIDQLQVEKLAKEFETKRNQLNINLKEKFKELRQQLQLQEQRQEAILNLTCSEIESGIERLRKVPRHLFEDVDLWRSEAKDRLDMFEKHMDTPNFINYDMIEIKNSDTPDLILVGEQIVNDLEAHKDVNFQLVQK